ncbi:hypothetical protein RH858_08675 [Halalkaliarchaeum sp. AArc-GB]|uniref:hypothetical protein n=1 Tax=Halalkaliarchaeum sp. AArc-GB TaxID=3074078 RepID=UPI00285D6E65|nr:hypothetical protein [Halalkaliarchaeum sp. AArc-GB]MDR5673222.1 hypothetical protein [Halalkaliarchaeum sp. AArc-GB]
MSNVQSNYRIDELDFEQGEDKLPSLSECTAPPTEVAIEIVDNNLVHHSLTAAANLGVRDEAALLVAMDGEGRRRSPRSEAVIQQESGMTLVSRGGDPEEAIEAFQTSTSQSV